MKCLKNMSIFFYVGIELTTANSNDNFILPMISSATALSADAE